jgi:hypothetical protein
MDVNILYLIVCFVKQAGSVRAENRPGNSFTTSFPRGSEKAPRTLPEPPAGRISALSYM